jgi:hypothetical protein
MFRVLDRVTLKKAMPDLGLNRGAVGSILTVRSKNAGYEVEFAAPAGKADVVVTLKSSCLKAAEH